MRSTLSEASPFGYVESVDGGKDAHYLYNHVRIIVKFSENEEEFDGKRIVGFEVVPMSVDHQVVAGSDGTQGTSPSLSTCKKDDPYVIEKQDPQSLEGNNVEVLYTYDVNWEESEVEWANRYDIYLRTNPDDDIHYFSIVNSLMILLFLTGVVAMIMLRTLHKDISSTMNCRP